MKHNKLSQELSPYLQQHAQNPVDWYPWGNEAIEKAKRENKPILLSIGYAACHWCHVMAHESFEDESTAQLMNQLFVNIKVDREERPDLDKIYQTAHQFLTHQSGGWPLTVFLSPNHLIPFYTGTYFPSAPRYQLPSFKQVLQAISDLYHSERTNIELQNQQLLNVFNSLNTPTGEAQLNLSPVQDALIRLEENFDTVNGGLGHAPKFPQASKLTFLLTEKPTLAIFTLQSIARSGLVDHLGGGFYRYSVDAQWHIPHFEKMLYDNAQLLYLYAIAAIDENITRSTAEWTISEMQSKEGGYYASIDADSEKQEGKFYVWEKSEIEKSLSPDEYNVFSAYFGLNNAPNFEELYYHLYIQKPELKNHSNDSLINSAKQKLWKIRNSRIHPHLDHKILTSWNALMIKAMATAGDLLEEPRYLQSAENALHFIKQNLWKNESLFASQKIPAFIDDYAFLLDAVITLLQIRWKTSDFNFAIQLADRMLRDYYDESLGGFFFSAHQQEKVIYRLKSWMDEATPSGNGIATQSLIKLGYMLADTRYLNAAEKTLQAAWSLLKKFPAEHTSLIIALKEYLQPTSIVTIFGEENSLKKLKQDYKKSDSHNIVFCIPQTEYANLPPALKAKADNAGQTTKVFVCTGLHCE